jgi:hypothetical protein
MIDVYPSQHVDQSRRMPHQYELRAAAPFVTINLKKNLNLSLVNFMQNT